MSDDSPLLNPLATLSQLASTPSSDYGIPHALELDLRAYGAQLIHRLGLLLSLPQRLTATAQVLFQRFWFVTSLRSFGTLDVALATVFLASKLEESPIRLRDLINCFDFLVQKHSSASKARRTAGHPLPWDCFEAVTRAGPQATATPASETGTNGAGTEAFVYVPHSYQSSTFYDYKDAIVVHEMHILKRLGFQLEAHLPYATLVNYLNVLGLGRDKEVIQRCWSCCSDMLQTPLPALFPPHILSVSSIYFLSLQPDSPLPALPRDPHPWWTLFDATLEEMRIVCSWLAFLYDQEGTGLGLEGFGAGAGASTDPHSITGGIASRVREDWGGMIHLSTRESMRRWLEQRRAAAIRTDE